MREILEVIEESVIIVNFKSKICYCNPMFAELVKMDRKEIEGEEITHFFETEEIEENCKQWKKVTLRIKNNFIIGQAKKLIKQYHGEEVYIYIIREIENRMRIELYEELLDQIGVPVWIRDPEGKLYYSNKALSEMRGRKNISDLSPAHKGGESDYIHGVIDPLHKDKSQMSTYNIIQEQNDDKRIYMEQLRSFRGENINKFFMGMRNDITGICEAGTQVSDVERECLDELGIEATRNMVVRKWGTSTEVEKVQQVQERIRRVLKVSTFMICLFTKERDLCLVSSVDREKGFKSDTVSIPTSIQKRLIKLNKIECSWKEMQEFQESIGILTEAYRTDCIDQYEIYPIKFSDNLVGVTLINEEHKSDRGLLRISEVMFMSHQLAIFIKNKLLKQDIYKVMQQQKEAKSNLKHLLQVLADVVVCIDQEGNIADIKEIKDNSTAAISMGRKRYIGTSFLNYICSDDRSKIISKEQLKKNRNATCSVRILSKDNEYIWYKWTVNYDEDRQRYICIGRDITYEKVAEVRKKACKQAREIEKIRNEFFANISHEFRTPINIILSSVKLLDSKKEQEASSWYTQKIEHNALRLLKISNNLIDLTRMGIGNDHIQMRNQNMVSLIKSITLSAAVYAQKKEIKVLFNAMEEKIIVACNAKEIERMLLNLLSNAVKFTPRGGLINVSANRKNTVVEIRVRDTGIGIPKEKCDIIFERFVQVDTSLRRISEGSGMGLAIVKRMVELHNGTIRVESEEGKGTTFIIELPIIINREEQSDKRKEVFKDTMDQTKIEFSDVYYG